MALKLCDEAARQAKTTETDLASAKREISQLREKIQFTESNLAKLKTPLAVSFLLILKSMLGSTLKIGFALPWCRIRAV